MAIICKWILTLFGWKVEGFEPLHQIPQYVLIAAPHSSNWDFPLGILVRCSCELQKVRFLAKSNLFAAPIGWIFRAMGGFPVDRKKSNKLVENYIQLFSENPDFAIVIAPEGTRKKVDRFKTGFYFIAKGAGIPIIMCRFDYGKGLVDFSLPFWPTEDEEGDITNIENYYRGIQGKNLSNSF